MSSQILLATESSEMLYIHYVRAREITDIQQRGRQREETTAHIILRLLLPSEHVLQPMPQLHFNRLDPTQYDWGKVFGPFISAHGLLSKKYRGPIKMLISYKCFPHCTIKQERWVQCYHSKTHYSVWKDTTAARSLIPSQIDNIDSSLALTMCV